MKKFSLFLLFILMFACTAFGQIDWVKYSQSYENGVTDKNGFGLITAVLEQNDSFWIHNGNGDVISKLMTDTAFTNHRRTDFTTVSLFDTSKAYFFVRGIDGGNAAKYEYRVVQNHIEVVVPWSPVTTFTDPKLSISSGLGEMAYLGGYRTEYKGKQDFGSIMIVDVREKASGKIISTAVARWKKISPILLDIYTANELNDFLARLGHPGSYNLSQKDIDKWKGRYRPNQLDPTSSLPKKLVVKPTDNNLIFYITADINDRKMIEYQVIKDNKVFRNWQQNDFDNSFIWLKNLPPGEYRLKFRFSIQRENITTYPFEIKTAWYQSTGFKIIGGSLIAAFGGAILFLMLWLKQRQNAARELSKKTKLQLELQAIHSQLNPHFVFNALSSIQGLINKNDIAAANNYLSDFAGLLRNSLSNSNKEQTPMHEELKTLETYLKLEQLRFKFKYEIAIDSNVNVYETEIPSLLIQPLIENSIKHGISGMMEKGQISLNINRNNSDMLITLRDNGNGFILTDHIAGLGLKLTRDRIKLLNEVMKGQQIIFEIKAAAGQHTVINLTFKNWFDEA